MGSQPAENSACREGQPSSSVDPGLQFHPYPHGIRLRGNLMPSVFDATNKIPRRVKDPITDDTLPSPGSLNWKQITSATALAGTTGVDCILVHGDRWTEMKGSLKENYAVDKTITVKGKHTETII